MASRGNIGINIEECKGCGLCIESCPPKCLEFAKELSPYGVHPARYTCRDCTGCGICFYCCLSNRPKAVVSQGGEHAAAL